MWKPALSIAAVLAASLAAVPPVAADKALPKLSESVAKGKVFKAEKAKPGLTIRAPDLVPVAAPRFNGVVAVRNVGSANAGPSILTVECNRVGRRGGCAEDPAMAAYTHPAYPNKAVIKVPPLPAGKSFKHRLKFWKKLKWSRGMYRFTIIADDGNRVRELNEGNNRTASNLSVH